ncbi:phosphoribosylaminoimidazolesuccinocarboxamide synthase [Listeria sp. PSOL-1]|uniref:phosphoribosylaminoimidazolesuccinocarboxamide synthase n=1 Tax=Listeria sp. PSOL-1 TaxID=1844999 RepID=UPI0013CFF02B|nr:phosphoribosylaminoimidazolesuccinocarboxamide synthase [Listeria sp. PSOL-1]
MNELIYEGKAKQLFRTDQSEILRVFYKDQVTALNGARKEEMHEKGQLNNQITSLIFEYLIKSGIKTHFIKQISANEQLVSALEMIPLEVVVRNVIAGSLAKRFGKTEGKELKTPIIEFYYKADELDDPFINDDHICYLNILTKPDIELLRKNAWLINQMLQTLFTQMDVTLVDFKLEFGRNQEGELILADEISPDTCRLWDKKTGDKLDKDVFRRNIGNLISTYQEVLRRLKEGT